MSLPAFLEPRPPMPTDDVTLRAFDAVFDAALQAGGEIDYGLSAPRWQFLCHIADTRRVLLHGSTNPDITHFEPRQPTDTTEFGNQNAVYAASDGLWPMYFAILDRQKHAMSTINTSVRVVADNGELGDPGYFFSISAPALALRAFTRGMIYVLPRATFRQQPVEEFGALRVVADHWASPEPVAPLFRIAVGPEDFPLLAQIRGHDDEMTFARARANPRGFPWLPEGEA
jgi:hypothetical protein